jgi:hypothetical protein
MTEQVTVQSQPYDTYASVTQADLYLNANFLATAWFDLTEDQKGQLLVTATRLFDRQCWLGEKTEPGPSPMQPLAWPRTSTGVDGVEDDVVPTDIVNGSIEMAFAILDGNEAVNSNVPGAQKLRSIGAGSVNLAWFRGAEGSARFNRFPLPVQELVKKYLCGQGLTGAIISGTDGCSITNDDLGYNEGV